MVYNYQGHFSYSWETITGWKSNPIGIYYCGYILSNGNLLPLYIGKSVANSGIRGRLLQHTRESKWPDVTHFGYQECGTEQEALNLEALQIKLHQPKYNKHLK